MMRDVREFRDFHVRREPRERYGVAGALLGSRGDLIVTDIPGIRRLAARMNVERAAGAPFVHGGEIAALGLLHEVGHVLIDRYERKRRRKRGHQSKLPENLTFGTLGHDLPGDKEKVGMMIVA